MSEVHSSSPETHAPIRVVIVDISEHRRQMARDAADARLGAETAVTRRGVWENIKDFKGMARRVWKGNILREYYQQKYYRQELDGLDSSGNLYTADGGDSTDATVAVVNRFASDFDEVIHTDAGETRDLYGDGDTAPNNIRSNIKDLISEFASGAIDEAAFEEEKNRVCALLANGNQDKIAGGLLYADNLLEIAQNVKAAVEHGRGLEDVMAGMEIVAGEAKMGARTEARFNRVDKIVDKLSRSKIGSLLPEALLASSVAVAVAASKFLTQKTVALATAVTGVLGISGGILGGLRESKRIKEERALHMRERAGGKQLEANSKRREALEETRYETIAANDATSELSSFFNEDGSMRNLTGTEYERAVAYVSQIGSRIKRSDTEKVDLLHFSSVDAIENERFALDLALARAKVGLRDYLAAQPPDFLPPGLRANDFDTLNSMFTSAIGAEFSRSESVKDAAFKTLKRKAILNAAGKATAFGMVFGALTQEGAARIPGYDSYAGLGESTEGAERTTLLRGWLQGHASETVEGGGSAETLVTTTTGSHSSISVPEGYTVNQGSGGEFTVTDPNSDAVTSFETNSNGQISTEGIRDLTSKGASVETVTDQHGGLSGDTKNMPVYSLENKLNIPKEYDLRYAESGEANRFEIVNQENNPIAEFTINPDGTIPSSSHAELSAAGIVLNEEINIVKGSETTGPVTPEEFVWINGSKTDGVRRVLWYGNDTPGKYDLNELRTHAGGVEGTWFDAEGNVVVDISAMRPDGSFWNGQSANPDALAADGSLRLAISVSKSTQDNVFDFKFETTPDGRTVAVIPKDSPVHQLFEAGNQENGHGEFNGRYIEIMEFTGEKDPAGAEQVKILGTYLGDGDQEGITTVSETTKEAHTTTLSAAPVDTQLVTYNPVSPEIITSSNIDVSPIVPIPIFGRRGLERLGRSPMNPEITGMYYGGTNLGVLQQWLRSNPEVHNPRTYRKNADGTQTWVERDGRPVERSVDKERDTLNRYLEKKRLNDPQYFEYLTGLAGQDSNMHPMHEDCRVSVNIPSWMEGATINSLLEKYFGQTNPDGSPINPDSYEINIIVNRKTGSAPDNSVEEINKFVASHETRTGIKPRLNYVDVEFAPPDNHVGNARKVLTDLTLIRSLRRDSQTGPLYIESEDADLMNVDSRTVSNIIGTMDSKPYLDSVRGIQDRNPEIMKNNDYLFMWRRMWDFTELLARTRRYRDPRQPGWNFTWNRTVTGGWNTAYSAESYAMIGGYDMVSKGEDMLIGEKMTMARGDGAHPNLAAVGRVYTRSDSSPRRFVSEILTGKGAYSDAFEDESLNKFIRTAPLSEMMEKITGVSRINATNAGTFSGLLKGHYVAVKAMTPNTAEAKKTMERLLFFLGFKKTDYTFADDDSDVDIVSLENIAQKLEEYRRKTA